MDNLAHTLCGAALARARLVPRGPLVTATLVLAANGPDVDALLYVVGDPVDALLHRRGWTHSLFLFAFQIPAFAALMLGVGRLRARRSGAPPPRWRPLLLASAAGYLSHLLLDLLNTYGVRFLLPFSDRWFRGDTAFIVDPWMWLLFGGATLFGGEVRNRGVALWLVFVVLGSAAMVARGVPMAANVAWGVAMVATLLARSAAGPRVGLARALVILLALYLVGLKAGSVAARERGLEAFAAARPASEVTGSTVNPAPAVPWLSNVVVETPETVHRVRVSLLEDPGEDELFWSFERRLDDPALAAHEGSREMRAWRRFAKHPFVRRDGPWLILGDARYSYGSPTNWANVRVPLRP